MGKVSIKDIAQKLGISNATVSIVLSGKMKEGRVSKDLIQKIRITAQEMNYEPNILARGLRMGKSLTIGLIVADISNPFFGQLAFQIQEHAEKFGYSVIITNTNESEEKMEKMISILKSRQVDGLIIVPTDHSESAIEELTKSSIPFVLLDRNFPTIPTSHVVVNNYYASKEATRYLIKDGCKKIGLIIYNNQLHTMLERKRGYVDALQEAGLFHPELIKCIEYQTINEDVVSSINDLLKEEKKVDGIFFATNTISMIGIKQILDLNLKIPEDVKVFCFDKSSEFDLSNLKIPYVLQPIPEMGKEVVELLIGHIDKSIKEPTKIELIAQLSKYS